MCINLCCYLPSLWPQGQQLKKELTACSIAMELPPGHALRNQLDDQKNQFEKLFETSLDCSGWLFHMVSMVRKFVNQKKETILPSQLEEIKSVSIPFAFHAEVAYVR